nr:O-methyltransferase [Streptomyces sp. CBMA152]
MLRSDVDSYLETFLDNLYVQGKQHDAQYEDRLLRLRNVEPESARLLHFLVRATGARTALEIGTSNGHSTAWIAAALPAAGGHLTSVEILPERSRAAAENLTEAGLRDRVELLVEDASKTLARSPADHWDFVFLDAERKYYPAYWPELRRTIRPGGILAVDNVLSHAAQVREFIELVQGDPDMTTTTVPTGAGVLLVLKDGAAAA